MVGIGILSLAQAFGIVSHQYLDDKVVETLGAFVGFCDFIFECRKICKVVGAKATK